MAKKKIILEDDFDFADYGKLRASGRTLDESLDAIRLKKKLHKISHLGNTRHNPFHHTDKVERKLKEMF